MAIAIDLPEDLFEYEKAGEPGETKAVLPTQVRLKCGCENTISWTFNAEGKLTDIVLHAWKYPNRIKFFTNGSVHTVESHVHLESIELELFERLKRELMQRYRIRKGEMKDGAPPENPA